MRIIGTASILAILAGALVAQEGDRERARGQERGGAQEVVGDPDKFFMHCAAQSNLGEISAGQLAATRGQGQEVKDFGRMMVEDHTKANQELGELMRKKGVPMPMKADEGRSLMVAHLSRLQGADFDREYIGCMVAEHAKAVAEFEGKSKTAKDPDLKAWASKTLEGLKKHHEMAKEIFDKLSGGPQGAK